MISVVLYRFLESYFRHRWLYLLPVVIMLLAAALYITNSEKKFIAKGSVYVQKETFLSTLNSVTNSDPAWWTTPAQAVIADMNELIKTDAFIRAVIYKTNLEEHMDDGSLVVGETITEVRDSIWVLAVGDNQIQINSAHEDPLVAYQITNAVLNSFIQWQVNAQRTESEAAQDFFANLINEYGADLETARQNLIAYLAANPPPLRGDRSEIEGLEISRLQSEVQLAQTRFASALEKEENARLALAQIESDTRQTYMIIDAPTIPEKAAVSRKELAIQVAIFLAAGVVLSFAAIAGNLILDRSFRFPIDVYYNVHLPVLAMIPDTEVKYNFFQRIKRRISRKRRSPSSDETQPGADEEGTSPNAEYEAEPAVNQDDEKFTTEEQKTDPVSVSNENVHAPE